MNITSLNEKYTSFLKLNFKNHYKKINLENNVTIVPYGEQAFNLKPTTYTQEFIAQKDIAGNGVVVRVPLTKEDVKILEEDTEMGKFILSSYINQMLVEAKKYGVIETAQKVQLSFRSLNSGNEEVVDDIALMLGVMHSAQKQNVTEGTI